MPEIKKINLTDRDYPVFLREIPYPPSPLYLKGVFPASNLIKIAIVGTRKPTELGIHLAKKIAKDLAKQGLVIVSGLALGIDSAAHQGCLDGGGQAIAVLGSGLDKIYPVTNRTLAQRILNQRGALISEYPPGTPALPHHFPARNRIISGLSQAVVVIEAPRKSGALITAKFALEQNREVFVVPGPANHLNYQGSHWLIREGARLVCTAEQILEDLNIKPFQLKLNQKEKIILEAIQQSKVPLTVDKLVEVTKLDFQAVNKSLTTLLVEGLVEETLAGYQINTKSK